MKTRSSQLSALERMQAQLLLGKKPWKENGKTHNVLVDMTENDKQRLSNEIAILQDRIDGVRRKPTTPAVDKSTAVPVGKRYVIEIWSIKYGFAKKADKKAAKGKSKSTKTSMKRKKTLSLVNTVSVHSKDLLEKYKLGQMGISPKHHVFKLREVGM